MDAVEKLQNRASVALKTVIITGMVSMSLFGGAAMTVAQGLDNNSSKSVAAYTQAGAVSGITVSLDGSESTIETNEVKDMGKKRFDASVKFSDMQDHWSVDSISKGVTKGYVDGYPDGTFLPDNSITRAEFLKMVVVAKYGKQPDSSDTEWYAPYISAAKKYNLLKDGDLIGDYNENMTRIELAKIAMRSLGKSYPTDAEWMYEATLLGIVQGIDMVGNLGMYDNTTRAQSVVIVERLDALRRGEKLDVSKEAVKVASNAVADVTAGSNIFSKLPAMFNRWKDGSYGGPASKYKEWLPQSKIETTVKGHKYTAEVKGLTLVDYNDPNDPNRHLIPDLTDAYWANLSGEKIENPSQIQAWVLVPDVEVSFDDWGSYEEWITYSKAYLNVTGFKQFSKGFNEPLSIYYEYIDSEGHNLVKSPNVIFIPKNSTLMQSTGRMSLYITTPNFPNVSPVVGEFFWSFPDVGGIN